MKLYDDKGLPAKTKNVLGCVQTTFMQAHAWKSDFSIYNKAIEDVCIQT